MSPDDQLRLMRRVAVSMFVVGGLMCTTGIWTTQVTTFARTAQALIAGSFVLVGLLLWALPTGRRIVYASLFAGVLLLSTLMGTSNPVGMTPFFYLWPVVYAAYFGSVRLLAGVFVCTTATLGAAVTVNAHVTLKADTFLGTLVTVGLMASLVAVMQRREARLRDTLAQAAHTDPLTGVLNRRAFNPALAALLATPAAATAPMSVVMFDLDHFKRFNDEHGHIAGDAALQRMADVLRAHARQGDLVSRFGGEEFAVALVGADAAAARRYAERVCAALHMHDVAPGLRISTSAGIDSRSTPADTLETMLARADEALYAAKQAGRARAAWWDGALVVGDAIA